MRGLGIWEIVAAALAASGGVTVLALPNVVEGTQNILHSDGSSSRTTEPEGKSGTGRPRRLQGRFLHITGSTFFTIPSRPYSLWS